MPKKDYDADKDYKVTFARPAQRGRMIFSPRHDYVIKGRVLAELPREAVKDVKPV